MSEEATLKAKSCSIFNDVLGPLMRGPSSSHSAAPYAIALTCKQLSLSNNEILCDAVVRFDPDGSFAHVHIDQGSDEGFAAGFMGIDHRSSAYLDGLRILESPNPPFRFRTEVASLAPDGHPNLVEIRLTCKEGSVERTDRYLAVSTGGGAFQIIECNSSPVEIDGQAFSLVVECTEASTSHEILGCLRAWDILVDSGEDLDGAKKLWAFRTLRNLSVNERAQLSLLDSIVRVREAAPTSLPTTGEKPLFSSGEDVLSLCRLYTLPEIAVQYESRILGVDVHSVDTMFEELARSLITKVEEGLAQRSEEVGFKILRPTAFKIFNSRSAGKLIGEPLHHAISGALAVMETSAMHGLVVACPTGGSAGILPGCLYSLKQTGHTMESIVEALKTAGVIGAIIGIRGTFAAELSGCAVETGAAAAMAAAGMAHAAEAPPVTVFHAASLCLMNTIGLVCDPIGGTVEVPCHGRNLAGVGHAFVASGAAIGGFDSFIPFDEAVDAVVKVGKCLPSSLRCTSKGGLAATPTAALQRKTFVGLNESHSKAE